MQALAAITVVVAGLGLGMLDDKDGAEEVKTALWSGWRVVHAQSPERWMSLEGAKALLGGIEVTGGFGRAGVSSRIMTESGERLTLASGNVPETSFSVGLFGGPMGTGWRLAPTGGWFTRDAEISDFSASLPSSPQSDSIDVGATCSDPNTGASISCQAPNRYDLELQSYYGGVLAGYEIVVGNPRFQLFAGGYGSLNVIERRTATVSVADQTGSGTEWKALRSFGLQGTTGFKLPRIHTAFRMTFDYQRYGRFALSQPLEFRGPVVYDEEREVYLRPRYTVEDTALGVLSLKFSAAYIF